MMGNRHLYAGADDHFYDHPAGTSGRGRFGAADRPAPAGWRRRESGTWVHLSPKGVDLPDQGWKIHVSAGLDDAEEVIDVVSAYCLRVGAVHKFLPDRRTHLLNNSKYARRGSSGKLMAVYSRDAEHLRELLAGLDPLLAGRAGPYILGDLRWRQGPLYLRYGGFRERWTAGDDGERVLALARPDGTLEPDRRGPSFRVPPWLDPPAFVTAQIQQQRSAGSARTMPYTVERALHFSNGGGVYLARDRVTGEPAVLREARPMAGLDGAGVDAVRRLHREAEALEALAGLDCVPRLLRVFQVWEHHYLATEYVEGETLWQYMVRNNPLTRPAATAADTARYTARTLEILGRLEEAVDAVHRRGIVFGDLHPGNVMLRPDGRVCLVDFEIAHRAAGDDIPAMGCPGYVAPHAASGPDRDRYALDSLRLALFLPLTVLLDLAPGKLDGFAAAVGDWFPVPPGYTRTLRRALRRPGEHPPPLPEGLFDGPDTGRLRAAAARAVTASATPQRRDRLFPGDPAGLTDGGCTIDHGAAGVLLALAATGAPVDPDHVDWLERTALRSDPRPGLYAGLHGTALALHRLGRTGTALRLFERAGRTDELSLYRGLAGQALVARELLRERADSALADTVEDAAGRLADGLERGTGGLRGGLLHGASGIAAFLLQRYEDTGDPACLDLAARAIRADLARCRTGDDGTVALRDGNRLLPYLAEGGAGVGLVLGRYLRHRANEEFASALEGILLAARARFTIHSSLFTGRAGLIALLAAHRADPDAARALRRHLRLLSWHAVPYEGGAAFPGEQLFRLSMDVGTGTAGVLLALHAAETGAVPLPGIGEDTAGTVRGPARALTVLTAVG
jgi:hypothetical protein